jgi:hypothetical protein
MSGRKISDHSSFAGSRSAKSVLPEGVKIKMESERGEDGGAMGKYEDTFEAISSQQRSGVKKMRSHSMSNDKRQ